MANTQVTIKTYEFKIRPNKKFVADCERVLQSSRFLHNCLLEQRISYYQQTGKSLNKFEQSRQITEARNEFPELAKVARAIQTDVLDRLDQTYQAFFKRGAGFPRFKGKERYHTFSQQIEKQRACPLRGDRLHVPSVGSCRVRLSRPLPEGAKVKQLRVTRRASGWYALLVTEIPKPDPLPKTGKTVGVDVGIKTFAALSNGEAIENPRCLKSASGKLRKLQRRLSRKKKGSANRKKAVRKVALAHEGVTNARKDFYHKTALNLVRRFDRITVEALMIRNLVRNHKLAKAILDVAWGAFFLITQNKAESAGREFIKRNPAYTSQTCSACGHRQKMPLKIRTFVCEKCCFVCDRDHNAAINLDTPELGEINACGVRQRTMKQERRVETSATLKGCSESSMLTRS